MALLLGYDVGSSSIKATLMEAEIRQSACVGDRARQGDGNHREKARLGGAAPANLVGKCRCRDAKDKGADQFRRGRRQGNRNLVPDARAGDR